MIVHEIGKYRLYYFGKRSSESNNIAQISFLDTQNQYVGYMRFYKEGESLPDNSENTDTTPKRVFLQATENQLDRVVDMLRNEKPCYVYYNSPTYAYIYTGSEPVGEEE